MEVELSVGFGPGGRKKVANTGDFSHIYIEEYDGSEYVLMSNSPIYETITVKENGIWVQKIVELGRRVEKT